MNKQKIIYLNQQESVDERLYLCCRQGSKNKLNTLGWWVGQTFGRQQGLIFGNSPYVPIKVTTVKIIYVVGEDITSGLIQLS